LTSPGNLDKKLHMIVLVNGEQTEVTAETLAALLEELGLQERRCATMMNGEIVRRTERPEVRLRDQDQVEIISMVGGG